jgi:hypothetical protein
MIWLVTVLFAGTLHGTAAAEPNDIPPVVVAPHTRSATAMLAAESRRVRSTNARITKLLTDGTRRSRTFADIVRQIHQSDVIVYVEPSFGLPPEMAGRILLQAVAGNQRYLRVQVRATLQGDQIIAVIAHELRHALEVAADRSIVNDVGLIALYQRIGHISHGTQGFDTEAAEKVGRLVRDELIG